MSRNLKKVLDTPLKATSLPDRVKWLSGEGCGSWFSIEKADDLFLIRRYDPEGKVECSGFFQQTKGDFFDIESEYEFTYLSHCAEVKIIQHQRVLTFNLIKKC